MALGVFAYAINHHVIPRHELITRRAMPVIDTSVRPDTP
jgi:hypothetical protein